MKLACCNPANGQQLSAVINPNSITLTCPKLSRDTCRGEVSGKLATCLGKVADMDHVTGKFWGCKPLRYLEMVRKFSWQVGNKPVCIEETGKIGDNETRRSRRCRGQINRDVSGEVGIRRSGIWAIVYDVVLQITALWQAVSIQATPSMRWRTSAIDFRFFLTHSPLVRLHVHDHLSIVSALLISLLTFLRICFHMCVKFCCRLWHIYHLHSEVCIVFSSVCLFVCLSVNKITPEPLEMSSQNFWGIILRLESVDIFANGYCGIWGWWFNVWCSSYIHHVSKKLCKIILVITLSNFHQLWKILALRWQRGPTYVRCTHFSPHLIYVNTLPCETQMFEIVT